MKDEEISQAHRGLSVKERVNRRSFPFLTIAIEDPQRSGDPSSTVYVTCLHLDYRDETIRLKEIRTIKQKLESLLPQPETMASSMHIWAGDFNALTKENYNYNQWYGYSRIDGWLCRSDRDCEWIDQNLGCDDREFSVNVVNVCL